MYDEPVFTEKQLRRFYLENIRMNKKDVLKAIADRDNTMKQIIESSHNKFTTVVQVGSFAKQTNIHNFDFDLLVICNSEVETVMHKDGVSVELYNRQGSIESAAAWLDELQRVVEQVCIRGSITRTRLAIKLCVDGTESTSMNLDMIPAIVTDLKEYIPDYSQSTTWKENSSKKDVNILNQRNEQYRDLKVVIQLLKYFRRQHQWKNLQSYALECLVLYYLDSVTVYEWDSLSLGSKLQKVLQYMLQFLENKNMSHRFNPTENLLEWLSDADVVKISSDITSIVDNIVLT